MTLTRARAADLLRRHGVAPRRMYGQNFVVDPNTVRRIARLAEVGPLHHVVEIGAGMGSLTAALAETGAKIRAYEIDAGMMNPLREVVAQFANVATFHTDVTKMDWASELTTADDWVVVANLPYNIATPLICDLLDEVPQVSRMLVMVQKEVGDRLVATARTEAYGAVSVKVAYHAEARIAGLVPSTVFVPRPNVDSALVSITRRRRPAVPVSIDRDWLFTLVKTGFAQRRKMLRRALDGLVLPEEYVRAGVQPEARAEELDIYAWGLLASHAARKAPAERHAPR